ncbi:MAG TPA: hypothetical protein DEB06_11005 [Phycisphaerales bacterium]|nr:hypothetical protein [Phycisphaerales bacterium]
MTLKRIVMYALVAMPPLGAPAARAQCEGRWGETFPLPAYFGTNSFDHVALVDPDGEGPLAPRLAFSGDTLHTSARYEPSHNPTAPLQFRDGYELKPLPSIATIEPGLPVRTLMFDEDGPDGSVPSRIYSVGSFRIGRPGESFRSTRCIRYTGSDWEAIAIPSASSLDAANDAAVFDEDGDGPAPPRLFVTTNSGVVRFDGVSAIQMTEPGAPTRAEVLLVADPDGSGPLPECLLVTGAAEPTSSRWVYAWTGSEWTRLPGRFSDRITAIGTFDADGPEGPSERRLVACGSFFTIEGVSVRRLAQFVEGVWVRVGPAVVSGIALNALTEFDEDGPGGDPPRLMVAGTGLRASPLTANAGLIGWSESGGWRAIGGENFINVGTVNSLEVFDEDGDGPLPERLHVAGGFSATLSGIATAFGGYAAWDGAEWHSPEPYLDQYIRAAASLPGTDGAPDRFVISGSFTRVGEVAARYIAQWDGEVWSPLGEDLAGSPTSLAVADVDGDGPAPKQLIAAFQARPLSDERGAVDVAFWTGNEWDITETDLDSSSPALGVFDPDGEGPAPCRVFLAGLVINGSDVRCLVREWNGVAWEPIGQAMIVIPLDSRVPPKFLPPPRGSDDRLVLAVAGRFRFPAMGDAECKFARWDGAAWGPASSNAQICGWPSGSLGRVLLLPLTAVPRGTAGLDEGDILYAGFGTELSVQRIPRSFESQAAIPMDAPAGSYQYVDMSAVGSFDPDGPGPMLATALVGLTTTGEIGPLPSLLWFDGAGLRPFDAPSTICFVSTMTTVDLDGVGPEPPRLILTQGLGWSFNGVTGGLRTPITYLREWIPSVAPVVVESPRGVIVRPGERAEFKVIAVGNEAQFVWRRDGAALGASRGEAPNAWTLVIDQVGLDDAGQYDAVVTNPCGEAVSDKAELRVRTRAGDADANGRVDFDDITDALANWGRDYGARTGAGDADSDGVVTMSDLMSTLDNWREQAPAR